MSTNEYIHATEIVAIKNQGDKENMVTAIANIKNIILTQGWNPENSESSPKTP
jgi:hypothetical protein